MPGQQMSIDADLNMGFIDQAEAQRRRKNIEKEAAFYGAMDGASKFVKGDAIAGIVILLINIVGGMVIGVLQLGMHWGQALQTYTLLTIGDGIVTQVPALVIAVGTGIIVTRSASDRQLSHEVVRQITSFPKTLFIVAAALVALLFLPGIPHGAGAAAARRDRDGGVLRGSKKEEGRAGQGVGRRREGAKEGEGYEALKVEPIEVNVGTGSCRGWAPRATRSSWTASPPSASNTRSSRDCCCRACASAIRQARPRPLRDHALRRGGRQGRDRQGPPARDPLRAARRAS
jgi:flagellar biosynthesis protein FlhA